MTAVARAQRRASALRDSVAPMPWAWPSLVQEAATPVRAAAAATCHPEPTPGGTRRGTDATPHRCVADAPKFTTRFPLA